MANTEKINKSIYGPARILIAPLDWGLGHTTRCIPIITAFLELGAEVTVAGNEKQANLLCNEIPSLKWLPLRGYNFTYSIGSLTTRLKFLLQIPKILAAINRERRWLNKITKQQKFDIIISDNRYGLRSKQIHSVFITHQLQIHVPFSQWLQEKLQRWNYHFINLFDECWVPDHQGVPNLAGLLSHPQRLPEISTKYIGVLSRFNIVIGDSLHEPPFILIILSGPEPQRTIFENIVEKQLKDFNGTAIVIRGLPGEMKNKNGFGNVSFINHLNSADLNKLMQQANFVICRSGYSSIMDIVTLQKKSIVIPTPGQTEQEYLAAYLMERSLCVAVHQKKFSLNRDLEVARNFEYADMNNFRHNELFPITQDLLNRIARKTSQVNDFN